MFAYNYMFLKGYLRPQKSVIKTFMMTNKICSKRIIFDDAKTIKCREVYSEAMYIPDVDPTVVDLINKGFAFLTIGPCIFTYEILYCFERTKKLNIDHKYDIEIECGLSQIEEYLKENGRVPGKPCCHYIEPR